MATELDQVYRCNVCGNIVEIVHAGAGELSCCNQPMEEMELKSEDQCMEKHVPIVKVADGKVNVNVGEVVHPMEEGHHIEWIEVYFLPEGEKVPQTIGRFEFSAHGAGAQGPNTSSIYTQPDIVSTLKTGKPGTVLATSYCNIHGLWSSSVALKVEYNNLIGGKIHFRRKNSGCSMRAA